MKKFFILIGVIILSLPAFATFTFDKDIVIDSVIKNEQEAIVNIKVENSNGYMDNINGEKVNYRISKWAIKCKTKEFAWLGEKEYGENNEELEKFDVMFKTWKKINNTNTNADEFGKTLYDKVCK